MFKAGNNAKIKNTQQQPLATFNIKSTTTKDRISFYLSNIEDKIIKEIDQQKQPISEHHSPFFETLSSKKIKLKQQQLKKLTEQRSKTQNQLKLLSDKQFELQHQYRMNLKNKYLKRSENKNEKYIARSRTIEMKKSPNFDNNSDNIDNQFLSMQIPISLQPQPNKSSPLTKFRPKSQVTPKDIQTLKNLQKSYIKFQESLINKTKQHNQYLQKIKMQNHNLSQLIKQQKNLQKRNEIILKLQQLQKQKLSRIQKFNQQEIQLAEIKKRPKIHQKISREFQQKQKSLNQQKLQLLKERLKRKVINVSQITQHEKKYQQLRNEHLKQIHSKYLQQSRLFKQSKFQPEKVSRFYRSVIQQQQQRKNQKKRKQLATIEKCERIKEYAAKVYEEHYPKVKSRQNDEEDQLLRSGQQYEDKSLSIQERRQLGNNYLREAIQSMKQQQKSKSPMATSESSVKQAQLPKISATISTRYKDYLSQQRNRYKSDVQRSQITQHKLRQKYVHSVEEVKKIMSEDINIRNKHATIQKIKKITQRMEHQPNDRNYIDKIRAKLKILQTIT